MRKEPTKSIRWTVGLTTTPERKDDLLPRTLRSLEAAGFPEPRLFVDGEPDALEDYCGHERACRWPRIRAFGNWFLAAHELWIRASAKWKCPQCPQGSIVQNACDNGDCRHHVEDRYLLTQDDIVWCRNVRSWLDAMPWPKPPTGDEGTYLNLYTFSSNEHVIHGKQPGTWHEAAFVHGPEDPKRLQTGRGAVALCFDQAGMRRLLQAPTMIEKPRDPARGHLTIDGAVVTAMNAAGFREMVHCPSLVRHTGTDFSVIKSQEKGQRCEFPWPADKSFPGENKNALDWLEEISK